MNNRQFPSRSAVIRIAAFMLIVGAAVTFATISQSTVSAFTSPVSEFLGITPPQNTEPNSPLANQYFASDGSVLSDVRWGTSVAGPFNTAFTAGNTAFFAIANGIAAGGTISVGGINATENFTITSSGGRIGGTASTINPITVSAGKTFDAGQQLWSNVATVGFSLNGGGVFATSGGPFGGGFVLNNGTLVARASNAMGSGGALTINGGTIAASDPVNFTGKFPGGINVNSNFQIGALTSAVPTSNGSADMTFSNNMPLGAATRTVTIGGNGNYIFGGIISGSAGAGLTVARLEGATGAVSLSGVNTYTGNTTINGGALALIASGSISNSPVIEIGANGILDVTALTTELTLASGQTLRATGTTSTGSIYTSSTKGLTTAANSPLQFTAFNGSTAPLTVTQSGTLTLQTSNPVTVTVANGGVPLSAANYKLIAKSGTASVAGTPTSVTVNGNGICAGCTPSLVIISGELFLRVEAPTVIVTTTAATSVTSSSANLNGTGNPNGTSAFGYFRYSTTDPGTCNDSFGTRAPASSASDSVLGSGSSSVPFSRAISGLSAGATYYFCSLGRNSTSTSFGSVLTFTTTATPPTVATSAASNRTGTTATLNGSANPNGASTTGWFRYSTTSPGTCNDSFGTRAPSSGGSALGAGNSSVAYSQNILGLTPGTNYFFCAIAQNSSGTSFGTLQQFTTPLPPTATTTAATSISDTSATLNGAGNPNGATTTAWFRYSTTSPGTCNDTFGTRAPTSGGSNLGSGTSSQPYSQSITGLSAGTTYFFCSITSSTEGTSFGSLLSFTTQDAPVTSTSTAAAVTSNSATLNGSADPNGSASFGHFRYSSTNPVTCNDSFGTRVPTSSASDASLGSGTIPVAFSFGISGLLPATTYYFCAIANNGIGTSFGSVLSLTTLPAAPTATTNNASNLTGTTATLNGSSNPGGTAATGWFRYSTTSPGTCNDSFGIRAPSAGGSALGSGTSTVGYSQGITGLTPGTSYFYCAIAQNAVGTSFGTIVAFTAPTPPTTTTAAASSITDTTATLNGSANPNGSSTTGWFRYSTTSPGSCNDTFGIRAPSSGGSALGSGTSSQAYSQPITGLATGTTYFFCAISASTEGTSFGTLLFFTTLAQPTVATSATTSVTSNSATLNGSANPNGDATFGHFRYSSTNPGTCNDSFGTRIPASSASDASLGSGTSSIGYSFGATGLLSATTYFYCAIANNSIGTSFGTVLSFTTAANPPTVTTNNASNLTGTTATLNGSANPGGGATTGWFRYASVSPGTCNDTFGTRAPSSGGASLGSGNSNVPYSQGITGLSSGTTYFYCAIAQNSIGTAFGTVQQFTTPLPPTTVTSAATSVVAAGATLNGSANPNGSSTTGWFRYSTTSPGTCNDTFGVRAPSSGGSALGAGNSSQGYSQPINGLSAGTVYFFCAIAANAEGTAFGTVLSFTTPNAPAAVTQAATGLTSSAATLNGSANPNGDAAFGHFRYSTADPGTCSDSFGTRAPLSSASDASLGSGTASVPYSFGVSALSAGTTYYFCSITNNSIGTSFGAVLSFTTLAAAPTVATNGASSLTGTAATLNGSANPNGDATTGWFRYSTVSPGTCNDTFGTRSPAAGGTAVGSGTSSVAYSRGVTGLSAGTTYFFCAIAQNVVGTSFGSIQQFTTPLPPSATTSAATGMTNAVAQLNGSGNPNGSSATGWFRYSATDPGTCNDTFGTRAPSSGGSNLGSGSSAQAYSQSILGLATATTYYFCAIVSSAEGTSFGAVLSFATTNTPPVISGTVTYGNAIGAPTPRFVSNVTITANGSPIVSTTTGAPGPAAGQYSLTGFGAGSYTITPTKTGGANGISSFDAARIAQHAVGISVLNATQLVVADVSNNGTVSSFDAAQIARYVAGSPPFGVTGTWRFVPVNKVYSSITGDLTGEDYSALLMGEVSGNWTNTGARPANGFNPNALAWLIGYGF
ncbi:MAG: hypothetical protein IPL32_02745 [Chloracidobacterium sp.]|nr:hypothetical protein [Chloracidobacterium sp.]